MSTTLPSTLTKRMAFSAMAIALSVVTSMIKLFHLPMGGSITLFSMFFITLVGYWYGLKSGIAAAVAYGLLQLIIDPYILTIPQLFIDYIFAFGSLGLSGLFSNVKGGLVKGYIVGVLSRYFFVCLSGFIFFAEYAPEGMSPLLYSISYNGIYIFTEAAITIALLYVPAISNALSKIKEIAQ